MERAKQIGYIEGQAKACDRLGNVLTYLGEFEEALACYQQSLESYRRMGRATRIGGLLNNFAFCYNKVGKYETALEWGEKSLARFKELQESYGIATASKSLAESHLRLGHLTEAEQFAKMISEAEDDSLMPDYYWIMAEIRFKQGNLTESEQLAQTSLKLAIQNQDPDTEQEARQVLKEIEATKKIV